MRHSKRDAPFFMHKVKNFVYLCTQNGTWQEQRADGVQGPENV